MEPKYLILIALSIILSSMLTISLLGIYPGPDSETGTNGNVGWTIWAKVKGWYPKDDPWHYEQTEHEAGTSLWGLVWYKSELVMQYYAAGKQFVMHTDNEYLIDIKYLLTSYAKTVAKR